MYQPLDGANAGHEDVFGSQLGSLIGGLEMVLRLGGYMVESNMGHLGDVIDPKAGPDPTIYGWRAAAESARLSKFVAAQVYGAPPSYSYVFGGGGGARRCPCAWPTPQESGTRPCLSWATPWMANTAT